MKKKPTADFFTEWDKAIRQIEFTQNPFDMSVENRRVAILLLEGEIVDARIINIHDEKAYRREMVEKGGNAFDVIFLSTEQITGGDTSADTILDGFLNILLSDDPKYQGTNYKTTALLAKVKELRQEIKRLNRIMDSAGIV